MEEEAPGALLAKLRTDASQTRSAAHPASLGMLAWRRAQLPHLRAGPHLICRSSSSLSDSQQKQKKTRRTATIAKENNSIEFTSTITDRDKHEHTVSLGCETQPDISNRAHAPEFPQSRRGAE